jgi:rod shape-determining protein MreD
MISAWFPVLSVVGAAMIQETALPWQAWSVFRPDLVLICLVYWHLYRPDLCGLGVAFLAGLTVDVLSGLPLGANAFTKVALMLVVDFFENRLRPWDYVILLPALGVLSFSDQLIQWGLLSLFEDMTPRWPLFFGRPVATALAAPILSILLVHIHRSWLDDF